MKDSIKNYESLLLDLDADKLKMKERALIVSQ
jgi:hypothetical protein